VAYCELHYFSPALTKQTAATVILPEGDHRPPYAVLYLLHGLSDDHTIWQRCTSVERYVADYPLIVVMPDGGRGFYCDAKVGEAWETAILTDLVGYVDRIFPTRAERAGRAIGGLSMGGYGAAKLALKHPDLFVSAVSHSGALDVARSSSRRAPEDPVAQMLRRILGDSPAGGPEDCFALAERLAPANRPALRIDCGVEDFLLPANRAFHAHLERIGYPHEYAEFPGGHEWGYWDVHVQEAIRFHARHLGLKKREPAPASTRPAPAGPASPDEAKQEGKR
jgi:S-formylglutathione hydrolase FrmB